MKVYKYRSNDENFLERDIATFSQNKFFASTFENLNDPFEANFNELITESVTIFEKNYKINADEVRKSFNEILQYKYKIGIFSLSKNVLSEQMWAHYSNSNNGYCIEYELDKINERNLNYDLAYKFDVIYKDILPVLTIDDIENEKLPSKMFGSKKEAWSYEKEIRLIFDSASLKEHHESAITGIYFGYKAESGLIEKLKDKFSNRDIIFYKIRPNIRSNFLEFDEICRFNRKLKFDLEKFEFELIKLRNNTAVNSYYLYVRNTYNQEELKELSKAFLEKYNYKPSNLYFLNSKSKRTMELIDKYPKSNEEYIDWAETVIADFPYDCNEEIFMDPNKDSLYKELKIKKIH